MFMRFYGLETIHSNDKSGSRCENGEWTNVCEHFPFDFFLHYRLLRRHRTTIHHHHHHHSWWKKYGREKYYIYKFLHISVLWQRGILRFICNKQNPARSASMAQYFVTVMQTRGNDGPEENTKQTDRKSHRKKTHSIFDSDRTQWYVLFVLFVAPPPPRQTQ